MVLASALLEAEIGVLRTMDFNVDCRFDSFYAYIEVNFSHEDAHDGTSDQLFVAAIEPTSDLSLEQLSTCTSKVWVRRNLARSRRSLSSCLN